MENNAEIIANKAVEYLDRYGHHFKKLQSIMLSGDVWEIRFDVGTIMKNIILVNLSKDGKLLSIIEETKQ